MRLIIKIGSNLLARADGRLNTTRLSALVDQAATLRLAGHEVVIVTSGAGACGRGELGAAPPGDLDTTAQRQLYTALGQPKLMNHYYQLFREYGLHVGQVLTTRAHFADEVERANQQACIELMLRTGVVPIVNENDTVCLTELLFTDNDELSGLLAEMLRADRLIILSTIDGLADRDPSDPDAKLLRHIAVGPTTTLDEYIAPVKSSHGRGGMQSKCTTALRVARLGIPVVIANGRRKDIVLHIVAGDQDTPCTTFELRMKN